MDQLVQTISADVDRQKVDFRHLAQLWSAKPDNSVPVWVMDAKLHRQPDQTSLAAGCVSISYVDAGLRVREVYPSVGVQYDLNAELSLPETPENAKVLNDARTRFAAIETARKLSDPALSGTTSI